MIALGRKAGEVAAKAGINEGYMSELVSGKKRNPSTDKLIAISDELGISISALFRRPPPGDAIGRLSPDQIETLGTLLDEFKGRDRG